VIEAATIFWDVGGVLLTNGWDEGQRKEVLAKFGVDGDAFEERHAAANDAWEKGKIDLGEYLRRTVFYEPRKFSAAEFYAAIKAKSSVLPDSAMGILSGLSAQGKYRNVMLNNESRELNDFRIEKFGMRRMFDFYLSSCYIGLRKPDAKMFLMAIETTQTRGKQTVFIDDRESNVEAAREAGMQAVLYEGPAKLKSSLAKFGIAA
jgi:putative hydrolase of the HAD superfamily